MRMASAQGVGVDPPESPRLRTLAAALEAGDGRGPGRILAGNRQRTLALLESLPGHPEEVLFTFIWRGEGDQAALNVQFNSWFPLHKTPGFDAFTRLGSTDVWYTGYLLPRNAHVRYELIAPKGRHAAPDRAAYFTNENVRVRGVSRPAQSEDRGVGQLDPLVRGGAHGPDQSLSAEAGWNRNRPTRDPAGREQDIGEYPGVAGSTCRPIMTAASAPPMGCLLVYDGNQYTGAVPTPTILDNMIAARVIPPVVAVFLESPNRDVEFPPNDAFQHFVGAELLPLLHSRYRIGRDPRGNAVLGSSYGGLAATYTAFVHSDVFGNVISQSGSYGWAPSAADPGRPPPRGVDPDSGWLIKQFAASPRKRIRFYLDARRVGGQHDVVFEPVAAVGAGGKGYEVVYNETDGNHSSYYWMLRLPDGLRAGLGRAGTAGQGWSR